MDGQPGNPRINSGFVDVRDVADLHLRAMTHEAAKGERFLAIAGESMWLADVAKVLKLRMGSAASRVSTRVLPNWLVRLGALREIGRTHVRTPVTHAHIVCRILLEQK